MVLLAAAGDGGLWTATPPYRWTQHPSGTAVSYLTTPLSEETVVIGAGAVHAWVRSSTPNVDLLATVTEVRPDERETYVQSGWLRGNERKLDQAKSTELEPVSASADATSARCPAIASSRPPSRSTTRGTPIAPARASG